MKQEKKMHTCPECGKPTSKYQLKKYGCCYECQTSGASPAEHYGFELKLLKEIAESQKGGDEQ